jgi:hypothetical protein
LNSAAKFALLFQLEIDRLGVTLAAISESTREVFLPDQSDAHTKMRAKRAQELFQRNYVEICACLCKKYLQEKRAGKSGRVRCPEMRFARHWNQ